MSATPACAKAQGAASQGRRPMGSFFPLILLAVLAASPAHAQGAPGAEAPNMLIWVFPVAMIALLYFFSIRPQQKRAKDHQAMVSAVKRGDTVVLSNGMVGKVTRVEDTEAMVEIASGVNTRVIKSMITEVRTRGEPVAADAKS
jgi:preprotein translocase subunit YajC